MILDLIFEYWPVTATILSALCFLAYKFPKAWSKTVAPGIEFLCFFAIISIVLADMTNWYIQESVADLYYEQQQLLDHPAPKPIWNAQKTCVNALIHDAEEKTCDIYMLMDITFNADAAIQQFHYAKGKISGQQQGIEKAVDHIRSITFGFPYLIALTFFYLFTRYLEPFLSYMKRHDQRLSDPIDGADNGKSDVGSNDET